MRSLSRIAATSARQRQSAISRRTFVTLAIETSCDDTAVAVAEVPSPTTLYPLKVHFHEKITSNSDGYRGIHPLIALHSHHTSLSPLLKKALDASPRPDLVAATRGPGMRSNLAVGLETAKGLALGLGVPFLGVHHMQAHACTPRLVTAMQSFGTQSMKPDFPFLTILASGGHTLLINSTGLTEHEILASTEDTALGDCIDKAARAILPTEALKMPFGKALEDFAFPNGPQDYRYTAPAGRQQELERKPTAWNWRLSPPLAGNKQGGRRMMYSFAGLLSAVERSLSHEVDADGHVTKIARSLEVSAEERRDMAREVQRVAFEHLASRLLLHLTSTPSSDHAKVIVVSGGVASNSYLRHVLRQILDVRGFEHIELQFPPVALCTDNALMIAWAAMEMWKAGYRSSMAVEPIRKWSLDPKAPDGGILGASGWTRVLP